VDLMPIKRVAVPAELLAEVRDEWVAHALSTEPADRAAAEAGVRAAYRKIECEPPRTIVWLGSPFAGVLGSYFLDVRLHGKNGRFEVPDWGPSIAGRVSGGFTLNPSDDQWVTFHAGGDSLKDQVRAQVSPTWFCVLGRIHGQLEDQAWHSFGDQVEDQIRAVTGDRLGAPTLCQSWDAEPAEVWERVRRQDRTAADCQRDAADLADYEINRLRRRGAKRYARLPGPLRVAHSAGRWWPMEDAVVLTERPTELHRDAQARPHSAHGPAIRYPDGWSVHAWHGVEVPADLVEGDGWTVERIMSEPNSEIRRCAVERQSAAKGWRHVIEWAGWPQVGATVPDPGNPGQTLSLYRVDNLYDEPVNLLCMTNGTPDRDGTRHEFGETVPADITDPVAAAAWQIGISADEYRTTVRRT
jgi:hypothetical protein